MNDAERNSLSLKNQGLVRHIVFKLKTANVHTSSYEDDDLLQVGFLGLLKAAERFDPARGTKFSTYACTYVRGFVLTYMNDHRAKLHVPVHLYGAKQRARQDERTAALVGKALAARQLSTDDLDLPSPPDNSVEKADDYAHLAKRVRKAMLALTDIERAVLARRYGFGRPALKRLKDIGAEMGFSKQRAGQILVKAHAALAQLLAS